MPVKGRLQARHGYTEQRVADAVACVVILAANSSAKLNIEQLFCCVLAPINIQIKRVLRHKVPNARNHAISASSGVLCRCRLYCSMASGWMLWTLIALGGT